MYLQSFVSDGECLWWCKLLWDLLIWLECCFCQGPLGKHSIWIRIWTLSNYNRAKACVCMYICLYAHDLLPDFSYNGRYEINKIFWRNKCNCPMLIIAINNIKQYTMNTRKIFHAWPQMWLVIKKKKILHLSFNSFLPAMPYIYIISCCPKIVCDIFHTHRVQSIKNIKRRCWWNLWIWI